MNSEKSSAYFDEAKKYIPGGVNSPVRAFSNIGIPPRFIHKAKGSKIYDVDQNEYIDYVGSWGPMLLGHAHPKVLEAVQESVENSTSFGAPCIKEVELAKLICNQIDCVDMIRMVNSGTEATMSAIRLARGFTSRETIIKFEGCYHGHSDSLLIKAGSGALTLGVPSSAGVPINIAKHTITLPYNDINALEDVFAKIGNQIACVILEPVAGNMGVVPPKSGFLETVRNLTTKHGAIFIMDEVMTGFRLSKQGAVGVFGVSPDVITFGKIIGGGLPVGAYGGRHDIMSQVSPLGPVYQAGTLSGNPTAMSAGVAMLTELFNNDSIYDNLERKSAMLEDGLYQSAQKANVKVTINRQGSMICMFFTDQPVYNYQTATTSNTNMFAKYFKAMLEQGIYLPPSQYESMFVSNVHTEEDIQKTINASFVALSSL